MTTNGRNPHPPTANAPWRRTLHGLRFRLGLHVRRLRWRGSAQFCNLCESHTKRFLPAGLAQRPNAQCPVCGSLERHRMVWRYLEDYQLLTGPLTLLHFAPETILEHRFRSVDDITYISADLYDPKAMLQLDITAIDLPDQSVDAIFCSHVMEHIEADRQAMREMRRILCPGGWLLMLVPILNDRQVTYEDPTKRTPAERLEAFGQDDHVRYYGWDVVDRLKESGFDVTVTKYGDAENPVFLARR